jgi:dipeptidyl aminopeptidase/acylaminoacyl peptidase
VAVVVHGGFWRARYGRRLMHALCADLAGRGWAAWNIEYRRLGRSSGGGYPRTLEDVDCAIDHLAALADGAVAAAGHGHPHLDLGRVVAIGHSAGGHLAAWAATRSDPAVPLSAVVSQAGVLDLRAAWDWHLSGGVAAQFLGGVPDDVPERCAHASPIERLPLRVPALLVHGGRDAVVPPAMSERFASAARSAGDHVDVAIEPVEEHMGHVDPANPMWKAVVEWL